MSLLERKNRLLLPLHFIKIFSHDNNVFSTLFLEKTFALRYIYIKVNDMNKIKFTCCIFCLHSKEELQGPEQSGCSFPPKSHPQSPTLTNIHTPWPSLHSLLQPLRSIITNTLSAIKDFQFLTPPHFYLFRI